MFFDKKCPAECQQGITKLRRRNSEEQFSAENAVANFERLSVEEGQIRAFADRDAADFVLHAQNAGWVCGSGAQS